MTSAALSSGLNEHDLERQFENGWDAASNDIKCPSIPADPHFRRAEPVKELAMSERKAISWGAKKEEVNASVTTKHVTAEVVTEERKAISWGNKATVVEEQVVAEQPAQRVNAKRKAVTWGSNKPKQQSKPAAAAAVTWKSNGAASPTRKIRSKRECTYCGYVHRNQCSNIEEHNERWKMLEKKEDEVSTAFCTYCKRQHGIPCNSIDDHLEYEKVIWRACKDVCNSCGSRTSSGSALCPSCS